MPQKSRHRARDLVVTSDLPEAIRGILPWERELLAPIVDEIVVTMLEDADPQCDTIPRMAQELLTLMRPFATAIYAKVRALKELDLTQAQQSRLRESISDDIKKASNFHGHKVSVNARAKAIALGVDLTKETWHEQHGFDPGRQLFIVERMTTVSTLRERCLRAADEDSVLAVLTEEIRVVWVLREEDERLTLLKYRSKRPASAYAEAKIEIWEGAQDTMGHGEASRTDGEE